MFDYLRLVFFFKEPVLLKFI